MTSLQVTRDNSVEGLCSKAWTGLKKTKRDG